MTIKEKREKLKVFCNERSGCDGCKLHCDFGKPKECFFSDKDKCYERSIYNRLREYENAEEQGLLLRLPCPIGTEVFEIEKLFYIDRKGCKDCIYFGNDGLGDYCDYYEDSYPLCTKVVPKKFTMRMLEDFNKTVFLTKAEAEHKLKEMESD